MKTEQVRKLGLAVGQIADALWEVQEALLMNVTTEEALQYHTNVDDRCQGCDFGCDCECDELPQEDELEENELEDEVPEEEV